MAALAVDLELDLLRRWNNRGSADPNSILSGCLLIVSLRYASQRLTHPEND